MVESIYYTGIGAKKNGKHTVKEFLEIMNKYFNVECTEFLPELDYKPCHEYKEMNRKAREKIRKIMEYNIKHNKPIMENIGLDKLGIYNEHTGKSRKKYKKLLNKCNKYKKTAKKRTCNLDEYVKFSGAEMNMQN
jgi:hypothetical protein